MGERRGIRDWGLGIRALRGRAVWWHAGGSAWRRYSFPHHQRASRPRGKSGDRSRSGRPSDRQHRLRRQAAAADGAFHRGRPAGRRPIARQERDLPAASAAAGGAARPRRSREDGRRLRRHAIDAARRRAGLRPNGLQVRGGPRSEVFSAVAVGQGVRGADDDLAVMQPGRPARRQKSIGSSDPPTRHGAASPSGRSNHRCTAVIAAGRDVLHAPTGQAKRHAGVAQQPADAASREQRDEKIEFLPRAVGKDTPAVACGRRPRFGLPACRDGSPRRDRPDHAPMRRVDPFSQRQLRQAGACRRRGRPEIRSTKTCRAAAREARSVASPPGR